MSRFSWFNLHVAPCRKFLMVGTKRSFSSSAGCTSCQGTVKPYNSHVFVSLESHWRHWPRRLEFADPFFRTLHTELDIRPKGDLKLTGFQGNSKLEDVVEVLVFDRKFPQGLRRSWKKSKSGADATALTVAGEVSEMLKVGTVNELQGSSWETITLPISFVCTHHARDKRCGELGGAMVDILRGISRYGEVGQTDHLSILPCSHVGGHRFAGNVVSFPDGMWLGNLDPHDPDMMKRVLHALQHGGTAWESLESNIRGKVWE